MKLRENLVFLNIGIKIVMAILNRLKFLLQAFIWGNSFLALLKFSTFNIWLSYSSDLVSLPGYQLFGAKLAATWLYWLGGSAYIITFILLVYSIVKMVTPSFRLQADRLIGIGFLVLASNLLCQLTQVGSYGNLPGGGAVGVWLLKVIILPKLIWQVLTINLLFAGVILTTRLVFMDQAHYLIRFLEFIFAPLINKIALKFNFRLPINNSEINLPTEMQKSVLEHEYQEILGKLELNVSNDLFWDNYITKKPADKLVATSIESANLNIDNHEIKPKVNHKILLPNLGFFAKPTASEQKNSRDILQQQASVITNKLKRFAILGQVTAIKPGPVITLFEFTPAEDAKISKILALENDLALALQTASLRIIAPVPGKSVVGFEVANLIRESVMLVEVLQDSKFTQFVESVKKNNTDKLQFQIPIAIGKDTTGQNVFIDLVKTPHLLVAGSTGSGKSVALNSILVSMLCANPPTRLRLILIDPKRLEFARYADMGHLLFPIICDAKRTLLTLRWVVQEMERRYEQMARAGVRNLADYNAYLKKQQLNQADLALLPYMVIVIDELADLMMTSGKDVEDLIIRIAQMARAAGIHMIVATQRPSVDVVTGLIKVNFPSRISFRVASKADSRTILDCNGADTLLGAGDMLMLDAQSASLKRAHGAYVTDEQVQDVVQFILKNYQTDYLNLDELQFSGAAENGFDEDEILSDVLVFLKDCDEVSISLLQRRFRIGYNRSARIMDMLESYGYVLTSDSSKMRKVLKDRLN